MEITADNEQYLINIGLATVKRLTSSSKLTEKQMHILNKTTKSYCKEMLEKATTDNNSVLVELMNRSAQKVVNYYVPENNKGPNRHSQK